MKKKKLKELMIAENREVKFPTEILAKKNMQKLLYSTHILMTRYFRNRSIDSVQIGTRFDLKISKAIATYIGQRIKNALIYILL